MQQINLYRFLPNPVSSPITLRVMLWIYTIFFTLLMSVILILQINKHYLNLKLTESQIATREEQERLITLSSQYPKIEVPMNELTLNDLSCKVKLSNYLEALSKASIPGIWLTAFSVAENGKKIVLQGKAIQTMLMEKYLLALQQQTLFSNMNFEIKDMSRIATNTLKNSSESTDFTLVGQY